MFFPRAAQAAATATPGTFSTSPDKPPLTRQDLIKAVADEHELTMAKSERVVKTVLDSIVEVSLSLSLLGADNNMFLLTPVDILILLVCGRQAISSHFQLWHF